MKTTRKCSFCGKSFVTRSGVQKYCSEACQAEAKRARTEQKNNLFKTARPIMEIQHQEYLTFSKAAILMGCSRQYVYKLVALGKLKASRISNRMAFIRKADIERMLEGNPYHRILPGSTSAQKKFTPSSPLAKKEKREKETDEVMDFYSGEEVMLLFKVKQSWLYTTAKRNRIPICRIAGKNYYSKKHIDEFFGVAVDTSNITDWLLIEEAEELFGMKPTALRAYTHRHKIPTKREYGRTYYSKSHLNELRRTDLVNDERYYTVEQVRQIYGLSSANICHIVKVKHIEKIKVGVKNLLLRSDVERVMAERRNNREQPTLPENYFKMIAVEVFTVVSRCSFATVNTGNTSENVQLKNIINMSKCKTVTLRKRKIKNGTQYSLCLDYYPGYRDNATMKVITREALGIYIFAKPANQQERDFNARMMKKAEILRNRRYEAIFNENNGFFDKAKMKGDFLAYFKELADRKNIKWQHVYKHFERFVNGKCTFEEVDVDLCRKFMEYLLNAPQSIHTNQKLHINSAAGYWSAFRAVLHTAYRDKKIKENPNGFLDRIECIPTMREHLSQEELIRLAETPCEEDVLKRAFLFACLTGLRKSDIRQLTWQQIQPYTNGKMFVTTRMQKTKQIVHNPISDEAYGLLGERHEGLIFEGFKDKMLQGPLKRWLLAAGITKKITFHCTRHSFGSLHVEMGTDMAVIQAYMGHKNITTTQIYSKMAAQQMCEVVDKITLKRKEA